MSGSPLCVDADAVLDGPAGLVEQLAGLEQQVAVLAGAVALRRKISGRRAPRRTPARRDRSSAPARPPTARPRPSSASSRRSSASACRARRTCCGWTTRNRRQGRGPRARAGPSAASRRVLRKKPCVPDGVSSASTSFFTLPARIAGKVVFGRPDLRGELLAEIVSAGLERLHRRRAVAEIFEADLVEVPAPAIDRQVLGPIVGLRR